MIAPERPLSSRPVDHPVKCAVRRGSVRTLAALWMAAWLLPAGAFAFQRIDAITLESGENFAIQTVIDPAGDFAYVATDTGPIQVVKIDLETFERVGAITLENGENAPYAVLIDHPGDFLYIGTISFPGRVVKIDLETFERVGAITLETGENSLSSAVIDPAGQFAYFGTGTVPGRVVKIDLETFERVGAITMEPDEDWLLAGVIDPAGDFAYFGTGTATRQVVKVDLATFQRVGAIDLGAGAFDQILSGVVDPVGEFAYFGTGDFPGQVAKVDLTSFEHVETITLESGEDFLFPAAIDPAGDFAYFGTFGEPGHVVKIDLETFERAEALTLEPGENWVISAVVDPAGDFAYFGTATEPGRLVRVLLGDPQPIADITPESFDFEVPEGGDDTQILTVGNLGFADLVWAIEEAELIAFTHEGSSSGTLDGDAFEEADFVITSVADPDDVVPVPPFATYIPHLSSSIAIEGIGTFDFVIPTTTFAEHLGQFGAPAVGFGPLIADEPVGVLWGPLDGVFASWDTTTPIGPINGPGFHLGWGFQPMETTGGVLAFDDTDLGGELPPFTFTAADLVCDDVTEIAWLSVAPESGTTPPEGSEPVSVTVDATGLSPGTFDATLCVLTNDPGTPLVPVPVTLTVIEGGAPELIFDPSSLDFGEVAVGETSPLQAATLQNVGDADATGLFFSPPGSGFEADTGACGDTLPGGESCLVSATFTPGEPGAAEATLEVTSDQGASASLGLSGNGIGDEGFTAMALEVDPDELGSDGNGVFEPGELVEVAPTWRNDGTTPQGLSGDASDFTGPEGAIYTLAHDGADYGTLDPDQTASCLETGVCYQVSLDDPAVRPATHWEATFNETLDDTDGTTKTWTLHIGDSFVDVPRANLFYSSVETLLHHGVTGGCTDSEYCPTANNTRDQMPVFVLKALLGRDYQPPACVEGDEVFDDVSADNLFCPWIEDLFNRGVVNGCGGGNYCPNAPVTRGQMAIFLLRSLEGSDYEPPACTGQFVDVPCPSLFGDWIEDLFAREITGGCSSEPLRYCPANPVNREQMAAFIGKAFALTLYEP